MIKVWLGSLSAYNAGALVGEWVSLPKEIEELQEIIVNINKEAIKVRGVFNPEEVDIFDYESEIDGLFRELEGMGLMQMNEMASKLDEMNDHEIKELVAISESIGNIEDSIESLTDGDYIAIHDVENEFILGYKYVNELDGMEVPAHLEGYIDYEAIGRDMTYEGWTIADNGVAVIVG